MSRLKCLSCGSAKYDSCPWCATTSPTAASARRVRDPFEVVLDRLSVDDDEWREAMDVGDIGTRARGDEDVVSKPRKRRGAK